MKTTKCKVEKNEEMEVSLFEKVTAQDNVPVLLSEVFAKIQNGHCQGIIEDVRDAKQQGFYKLLDERKKKLPAFTPSGVFKNGHSKKELNNYNPLIVLDIDKVGEGRAKEIKNQAINIDNTFAAFISPSGEGLKILVRTNSTDENHEQAFNQIAEFYQNEIGIEVDKSGKDYSRLCFLSYDPDLYLNEESEIFQIQTKTELPEFKSASSSTENYESIFQKAVDFTNQKYTYEEGNRNNHIHLLACNCNRFGLDESHTLSNILNIYTGLSKNEITATVNSAFSNTEEHNIFNYISDRTLDKVTFSNPLNSLFVPLLDSIAHYEKMPEPKYIWGPIVEGSFGYIYGPAGVGKTIFCEVFGIIIALGKDAFLDLPVENSKKRKVLFIAMEEYGQFSRKRNKKQIEFACIKKGDDFVFNVSGEEFPEYFNSEKDWQKLEKVITESKAEVVFIDSMTRATEGQIEDSATSRQVSIKLRGIAKKYGVTLIVIHHSTKLNGNKISMDSMAGSRVIAQEADFVIAVNMNDNVRYLKEIKSRYKPLKEDVTIFKINDNAWMEKVKDSHENYIVQVEDNRKKPEKDQAIIDAIKAKVSVSEPKVITNKLVEELAEEMSKSEFYRRLGRLSKSGKVNWENGYVSPS